MLFTWILPASFQLAVLWKLSQFTVDEVYTFHLSLFEMTKMERHLLILGKLQVLTRPSDTINMPATQSQANAELHVIIGLIIVKFARMVSYSYTTSVGGIVEGTEEAILCEGKCQQRM